jgi:hypothetical protein
MAILKRKQPTTIEIDLTGPQGNAFFLLGTAQRLSKQLGFDVQTVLSEMRSGDYENLIQVFDSYFGSVVTLYR